jgi:hypothetical protein
LFKDLYLYIDSISPIFGFKNSKSPKIGGL